MVYPNELIASGGDVEVRLFLVDEERVRHPDVLDELRADAQRFDPRAFPERQPRVRPELTEVEIQCEVLSTLSEGKTKETHEKQTKRVSFNESDTASNKHNIKYYNSTLAIKR